MEILSKVSGSCLRSQAIFGAVKPGIAMLPATARARGKAASISAHSAWLRPSFHRIAGRRTASSASRQTAPCIWPESPMPRSPAREWLAASASIVRSTAVHQAAGSCSDQPGWGRWTVSGSLACPISRWSRSKRTVFTDDVPISMPRYIAFSPSTAGRDARRFPSAAWVAERRRRVNGAAASARCRHRSARGALHPTSPSHRRRYRSQPGPRRSDGLAGYLIQPRSR